MAKFTVYIPVYYDKVNKKVFVGFLKRSLPKPNDRKEVLHTLRAEDLGLLDLTEEAVGDIEKKRMVLPYKDRRSGHQNFNLDVCIREISDIKTNPLEWQSLRDLSEALDNHDSSKEKFRDCVADSLKSYLLDHLKCVETHFEQGHKMGPAEPVEGSLWAKRRKDRSDLAESIINHGAHQAASQGASQKADGSHAGGGEATSPLAKPKVSFYEAPVWAPLFALAAQKKLTQSAEVFDKLPEQFKTSASAPGEPAIRVVAADCLLVAKRLVPEGKPILLNMANQFKAGGGFEHGAGAQEEDLYRRTDANDIIPAINYKLKKSNEPAIHQGRGVYEVSYIAFLQQARDLGPNALLLENATVLRGPGPGMDPCVFDDPGYHPLPESERFQVGLVYTAALDCNSDHAVFGDVQFDAAAAYQRIASALQAAACAVSSDEQRPLVLSALGCGAFRNPPELVARLFQLAMECHPEWMEKFSSVNFAIVPNQGWTNDNNFLAFKKVFEGLDVRRPNAMCLENDFKRQPLGQRLMQVTEQANACGRIPMFTYSANQRQAEDILKLNLALDALEQRLSPEDPITSEALKPLMAAVNKAFDSLSSYAAFFGSMSRGNTGQAIPFRALLVKLKLSWRVWEKDKTAPICCSARIIGIPTMKESSFFSSRLEPAEKSVIESCLAYAKAYRDRSAHTELHVLMQPGAITPDIGGGVANDLADQTNIQSARSSLLNLLPTESLMLANIADIKAHQGAIKEVLKSLGGPTARASVSSSSTESLGGGRAERGSKPMPPKVGHSASGPGSNSPGSSM